MKAIRVRHPASIDSLVFEDVADSPAPGPDEIKVRIRAASLNFRDALVVKGFFPADDGRIPLSDAAGEVLEIGQGVREFAPGDQVVSVFHPNWQDGDIDRALLNNSPGGPAEGYACELVTRPVNHFTRAPKGLTHVEAATLPCAGVTAWRAVVTDGQVKPGASVLVLGTGGVSLFALQFAKAAGAQVIATSSSPDKLARLRELGADHVIDYRHTENWGEKVLELTGGRGVDHVIEVGGPHTMARSLMAVRSGGHVAVIGAVGGFEIDTMPFAVVQAKRLRLQGVTVGSRRDQTEMIRAIQQLALRPVIDRCYSLSDTAEALRRLESGAHLGKVCVEV
jgi:NADPH:quinone reductase-like Zn-dependent oxidoreductase